MSRYSLEGKQPLEPPHRKASLSSQFGRAIERSSYLDIFLVSSFVLISSAVYFSLGLDSHTVSKNGNSYEINFIESIYFSIVTFTSLGYGDFAPVGFGRIVASLLVFWGLATIALTIGKIASERSQTTLTLLHRSDVQRRLAAFTRDLATAREAMPTLTQVQDNCSVTIKMAALAEAHQTASRYIVFHANQSDALIVGNDSALSAFIRELANVQRLAIKAHKYANQGNSCNVMRSGIALAYSVQWTAGFLEKHYNASNSMHSWSETIWRMIVGPWGTERRLSRRLRGYTSGMKAALNGLENWRTTNVTIDTMTDVRDLLPSGPNRGWPKGVHKQIAKQLGESNNRINRHLIRLSGPEKVD